jgi:hypothetical protein
MTTRGWKDDQDLFEDLTGAWRDAAPIAEELTQRAHAAYCWRTVDEDLLLASLRFDSAAEPVLSTRSSEGPRILVFTAAPLSVELEVLPDQIVGQLVPPGAAVVVVETEAGATTELTSDERGFFIVTPLPAGPLRLRCDTPSARLVTDWVTL